MYVRITLTLTHLSKVREVWYKVAGGRVWPGRPILKAISQEAK